MITWGVPRFSDHSPRSRLPQPWLHRKGGAQVPRPDFLGPSRKGPKQQKPRCCHNLLCQPGTAKSYRVSLLNISRIQTLASPIHSHQEASVQVHCSPWIIAARPFRSSFPPAPAHSPLGEKNKHIK